MTHIYRYSVTTQVKFSVSNSNPLGFHVLSLKYPLALYRFGRNYYYYYDDDDDEY